jgi:hypothetical protein
MAVDAVAVALAGADAGEVAVPVEGVALVERDALLAVVAEEAELDALGVLAEEREVRPLAVPGRAEGERRAGQTCLTGAARRSPTSGLRRGRPRSRAYPPGSPAARTAPVGTRAEGRRLAAQEPGSREAVMATTAAIPGERLSELRMQLRGEASTPSDPGYGLARRPFNAMHVDRPAVVVRCTGTADVVAAVTFARDNDLTPTVRGGGHSVAGLSSSDGGFVLDLSSMRGVQVDPEARSRVYRVAPSWVTSTERHRSSVSRLRLESPRRQVSPGLTLGGGYGWLRRKHGLACDNLVSAQVVGADGEVRTASAGRTPTCSGRSAAGAATSVSFTFLHVPAPPVGPVVAFAACFYPVESAAEVLPRYRDYFASAPDEVSSEALSLTFPADPGLPEPIHDQQCFVVGAVYAGDADQGCRSCSRCESSPPAGGHLPADAVRGRAVGLRCVLPRGMLRAYWKSAYVTELSDEVIEIVARRSAERPSGLTFVDVYPMGGEVTRVGPDESAFGERAAQYMVSVAGNWPDAGDDEANIAWVREAWAEVDALAPAPPT